MTTENIDIRIREDGSRVVRRNLEDVGNTARKSADAVDLLKKVLLTLGGAAAAREVLQLVDAYQTLQNRLRSTGLEGDNLTGVYQALLKASNDTRSSIEGSVELYARLAVSSKELGVSQQQLIDFTKSLNQAILLSGASATEAQAGIIQLSQGMASGTLRGDELRSVLEQLPAVADVIAKNLGVTRGQLRKLGEDGKITAQSILQAFQKARGELEEKFANTVPTLSQSFQILKNNFLDFVGRMDQASGFSAALSRAMQFLANNIDAVVGGLTALVSGIVLVGGTVYLVRGLATAFQALTAAIAANPLGALLIVVTSAITALTIFRDQIKLGTDQLTTLGDFLRALGEDVGRVFTDLLQWADKTFGPLAKIVKDWAGSVDFSVIGIIKGVAKAVDTFIGLWRGAVAATVALFEGVPPAVSDIFTRALNFILDKIGSFVNKAGELLNTVTEFAGLGKMVNSSLDLRLTNENAGAAARLGGDVAAAFKEGFNRSNPAQDYIDGLAKRAQQIGLDRRNSAGNPTVSTQAGPAAKTPVDAKELEKAQNALRSLLNTILPSAGAVLELAKAQKTLNEAQKFGLITAEQNARYLELARRYYQDIIDPLGKVNRELDEQMALLNVSNHEREVETQLLAVQKDLRQQGIDLTDAEVKALRGKLQALRDLNAVTQAQDQLLAGSVEQRRSFVTQIQAIQNLLADPNSGFTKADATNALAQQMPDLFAGTQEALDANLERFRQMYANIDALRQADLISEQTASQMRANVAAQEAELRVSNMRDLFGQLSSLQSSENKKIAAIGRAAAVTQATIDGVLAVQKALSAYPPPYNYAMAAAVGVTAAANVAKIMSSGYESGGYTGNMGRKEVAGVVHGQEFVMNARSTARYRDMLERMNMGLEPVPPGHAPGYYDGGYVTPATPRQAPTAPAPAPAGAYPAASPAQAASGAQLNARIVNVLDPAIVQDYLNSSEGEQVFVNMIRRNTDAIRTVMSEG